MSTTYVMFHLTHLFQHRLKSKVVELVAPPSMVTVHKSLQPLKFKSETSSSKLISSLLLITIKILNYSKSYANWKINLTKLHTYLWLLTCTEWQQKQQNTGTVVEPFCKLNVLLANVRRELPKISCKVRSMSSIYSWW